MKKIHNIIIPIYSKRISQRSVNNKHVDTEYVCLNCGIRFVYTERGFYIYQNKSLYESGPYWKYSTDPPDCNEYMMDEALK